MRRNALETFSTSQSWPLTPHLHSMFSYEVLVMRESSVQGLPTLLRHAKYADSNYRVSNKMQSMLHGRGLIRVFRNSATF